MNFDLIFPTVIGYEYNIFSDEDHNKIINLCYETKLKNPDLKGPWAVGNRGPYATFGKINIAQEKEFNFFISFIEQKVKVYAEKFNNYNDFICPQAWINIYNSDEYQEPHAHSSFSISAVYFVKAPEGSGNIVFQKPFIGFPNLNDIHPFDTDNWSWIPQDNMLLIFKSNLYHYVLHGKNKKDRISIAMNFVEQNKNISYLI